MRGWQINGVTLIYELSATLLTHEQLSQAVGRWFGLGRAGCRSPKPSA